MNETFDHKNERHRNLIAKLSNSIADLNFYAFRFLRVRGIKSTPQTGIVDAIEYKETAHVKSWPNELDAILIKYREVLRCTPSTANDTFYSTWIFVHNFDHILKQHEQPDNTL